MALPTRRVVYVGCVMAGKLYSVHSMLSRNQQPLPDPVDELRRGPHDFALTRAGTPFVNLSVVISDKRETKIDYDPASSSCDVGILREIDFIVRADGLIFVIDSRIGREEGNLGAWHRLKRDLIAWGTDPTAKPIVFQANKRDEANIVSMDWVRQNFRSERCAYVESVATRAAGTVQAMRELLKLTGAIE